jgi:hypothetical protein
MKLLRVIKKFGVFLVITGPLACSAFAKDYEYNPIVTPQKWNSFVPYFLPADHPVTLKLDEIFLSAPYHVLKDKKSLKKAKFQVIHYEKKNNPYVAIHPKIPGYIFKIFLDSQEDVEDGKRYLSRIEGALSVGEAIVRNHFETFFKVPRKWIYPVPRESTPPQLGEPSSKNFILVVEDMEILGFEKNLRKWKSGAITPRLLESIYTMLDEEGLYDTVYAFNLPFCRDGKLAFIDTEIHHDWPVNFKHLGKYLSLSMAAYWQILIERNN